MHSYRTGPRQQHSLKINLSAMTGLNREDLLYATSSARDRYTIARSHELLPAVFTFHILINTHTHTHTHTHAYSNASLGISRTFDAGVANVLLMCC